MTKFLNISTDNTLGGNSPSDDVVSSQKAVQEYVDSHSSSVSLDNSTISTNSSNQLQAIGLINKNTASGATNPKYDWVGTLQEYNDQAVAINHPEWICYITDDVSGGESVYTKAETNSEIATAISTMLSSVYPVGAVYIGTTSTCPMESLISGSTWVLRGSGVVTGILASSSAPVKGTGKTLGLTNGTDNFGMANTSPSVDLVITATNYNDNAGSNISRTYTGNGARTIGITTDGSKSGVIADLSSAITSTSLSVNIWERTA